MWVSLSSVKNAGVNIPATERQELSRGGRAHFSMRADEAAGITMDATADVDPVGAFGRAQ